MPSCHSRPRQSVDDEVGLRAVERRFALGDAQLRQVHASANRFELALGAVPHFRRADVLVARRIAEAEPHAIVVQAESLEHELGHLQAAAELVGHLVFGAEQVRVVLGEAAHAGHAVQLARLLEAIDGAELRQPHRQVAIAARPALVDHDVVRTVHRLEQILVVSPVLPALISACEFG